MYNSIIQSIAHLKLWLFPIFLAICGFHPKRTAPAWRPRTNQANFWYPVLMWTVFQWRRSASTGTNGSQEGQGLGYKAGGEKLPIHCFPKFQIVLNRNSNMGLSVVMMENYYLVSGRIFRAFFGYCSLQTDKLCSVAFSIDGFTRF